jgi:NADP-reducing hydrogenase subunit HndB
MSGEELERIKEKYIEERKQEAQQGVVNIIVHMGTCGISAGARSIFDALMRELEKVGLSHIKIRTTGCAGLCSSEPMITIEIPGQIPVRYGNLDSKKVIEIFYSHALAGHIKTEYAISTGLERPQSRVAGE